MYAVSKPKVSVMTWGCISWYGSGTLCKVQSNINAQMYIDILFNHQWPFIARHFPANNCLVYPVQSPDINVIENCWHWIKRRNQNHAGETTTVNQLFEEFLNTWQNFILKYIQNLYQSIPRRIMACIRSKGHLTKYWR